MASDDIKEAVQAVHSMTLQDNVSNGTAEKWGLQLPHLYQLAAKFYKEKEGKVIQQTYDNKLQFVALTQQVAHGPCRPENLPPLGVLDVIGRDRRQAWQALGDVSREQAMTQYVDLLDSLCPTFKPYAEAHKFDMEAKQLKMEAARRTERQEQEQGRQLLEQMALQQEQEETRRQEETKKHIKEALNQQTATQFRAYAEQQYPGSPEQQTLLIGQLQEQHYQQYMQQLYQQQLQQQTLDESAGEETESADEAVPEVGSASMWTRKDLTEFKNAIRAEGGDAVLKVGHGETVTIRVPTHEDGTCLFWEFATDSYDIGFGVFFEWGPSDDNEVTIHISESEDEEDDPENADDPERGPQGGREQQQPAACVIPVYRRDCHQEVYAGSHVYPGQGVYQLKFDNSYSLWRSKTLYYRVYYTR
ncbi:Golgi resident protein GCP60-like [Pollicipes pollicipes]|uniref:Golgi resident protein GCP60-like n=1 Tax=Pollicipes pollicipes TaxID=41117 RepID=UPI0018859074|nr:Golgi resident protein GCP60-like [Pollicipes pollicipes]